MSWFHKHKLVLVSKTYAEPINFDIEKISFSENCAHMFPRLLQGSTTFLWKCVDENCDHVKVVEAIGKMMEDK